jgi:hypothetical protein
MGMPQAIIAKAFLGKTVVNTFESESALAKGTECRRVLNNHYKACITRINEDDARGAPQRLHRSILTGQQVSREILRPYIGFGAYVFP